MIFLFVAPRLHTNQYEIIKALMKQGHRVIFHSITRGQTEDYSLITPIMQRPCRLSVFLENLIGEGGPNHPRLFPNPRAYLQTLSRLRPDYVVVRGPNRLSSLLAAICARLLNIPIIFYEQNIIHKHYSMRRKIIFFLFLRLFRAAWYSPLLGEPRRFPYRPKHMYFVPFAAPSWPRGDRKKKQYVRILAIGKFERRKNQTLLINAFEKIIRSGAYKLTLVGECTTDSHKNYLLEIQEKIKQFNLEHFVKIRVNIAFSCIKYYYASNDLFVLPARDEPASISVLESIANGLPAICSSTCGTRFYIDEAITGYVFRSDSSDDLATKILLITKSRETLSSMQQNCKNYYSHNISGPIFYSTFMEMIRHRW